MDTVFFNAAEIFESPNPLPWSGGDGNNLSSRRLEAPAVSRFVGYVLVSKAEGVPLFGTFYACDPQQAGLVPLGDAFEVLHDTQECPSGGKWLKFDSASIAPFAAMNAFFFSFDPSGDVVIRDCVLWARA